ncbi:transglutaminase family protein [Labrys wisconsinensis]|uniref:Transglutaminase-like putative cysteine protease n=1 Tax=Labrys wisconsinensis TaxID=425677 RepID=A0ABU0J5H1_9HYPH|nr:transglutaminase family protein [Labrys wisconsinensis]MDQ0469510.1 transglutaminase-like putative cysteine protease [Labrys wisconsinensis]
MRIRIAHETVYRYETPAKSVIQTLRLTPRSHDGQHVMRWRIDVDQDVKLTEVEDAFGNIGHVFSAIGRIDELTVTVEGEVETQDRAGVLRGTLERFPASLFLRETPLTRPDEALRAFARSVARPGEGSLSTCHALLEAVHAEIAFDTDPTHVATTAQEAFALKRGVCQDLTHVFIACARELRIPARYVSGHMHRPEVTRQDAGHAWAEAYVEGLGWVGFDPANKLCPTDTHVRIAAGLDYLGAAPVRGARYGGEGETLNVRIDVSEKVAQRQAQRQVQN